MVVNGLTQSHLDETADTMQCDTGVSVEAVSANVNTPKGRAKLLDACPDPDIPVSNNWGTSSVDWLEFEYEDCLRAVESNMLALIMTIRSATGGMRERRFGRIVNIISQLVKSPFPFMGLSAERQPASRSPRRPHLGSRPGQWHVNSLPPERIDTERQVNMAKKQAEASGSSTRARQPMVDSITAKRMGRPEELGTLCCLLVMCAFLCSSYAGYTSSRNFQLDGGSYRGSFRKMSAFRLVSRCKGRYSARPW